jgi:hypothetical protein
MLNPLNGRVCRLTEDSGRATTGGKIDVTPVKVSGLLSVSMDVIDNVGTTISKIDSTTSGPHHIVDIENISTVPRGAKIVALLPNSSRGIEFVQGGAALSGWNDEVKNIPSGATRRLGCDLRRNSGPSASGEPIQCDELYENRGTLAWARLYAGVPFQITIVVA